MQHDLKGAQRTIQILCRVTSDLKGVHPFSAGSCLQQRPTAHEGVPFEAGTFCARHVTCRGLRKTLRRELLCRAQRRGLWAARALDTPLTHRSHVCLRVAPSLLGGEPRLEEEASG